MAAETVDPSTHKKVQGASVPPKKPESGGSQDAREREKQMVASVHPPHQRHLNPFTVADRPDQKHLGVSAKNLKVADFVLLRTLGTGKSQFGRGLFPVSDLLFFLRAGTFARVWLARLKADERKDRVYALKILRKADGEGGPCLLRFYGANA